MVEDQGVALRLPLPVFLVRLYRCNALFVPRALAGFCLSLVSLFLFLPFFWGVVQGWLNVTLFLLPTTFNFFFAQKTNHKR